MFSLFGSRQGPLCAGYSRRDFLKIGALGLGGWTLTDLLRTRAAAAHAGFQKPIWAPGTLVKSRENGDESG